MPAAYFYVCSVFAGAGPEAVEIVQAAELAGVVVCVDEDAALVWRVMAVGALVAGGGEVKRAAEADVLVRDGSHIDSIVCGGLQIRLDSVRKFGR